MANYIESSLTEGESVETISKIHWMALVMPGVLTLLAALWFSSEAGQFAFWVMVSCVFWLLARGIYVYFSEVVVTNKRFVFKRGLISRNVQEIVYNKVDSTELNQ
ncbi:MAG: PH domain-containing protein, partial [Alphaproteobacteria bacterium]|nr:PH domain-containing protein [Alphaproteobacteria bacterium]